MKEAMREESEMVSTSGKTHVIRLHDNALVLQQDNALVLRRMQVCPPQPVIEVKVVLDKQAILAQAEANIGTPIGQEELLCRQ